MPDLQDFFNEGEETVHVGTYGQRNDINAMVSVMKYIVRIIPKLNNDRVRWTECQVCVDDIMDLLKGLKMRVEKVY